MELAAIACAVAFAVLLVMLPRRRRAAPSPRQAVWHFLMAASLWQLPSLVDSGQVIAGNDPGPPAMVDEEVWHDCQLALATVDATSLILDCLVPVTASDDREAAGMSVPITLRTSSTALDGGRVIDVLSDWAESERPVEIALEDRHGSAVVQVSQAGCAVTMLLEARMTG